MKAIDLFSGAGGLSAGLRDAGWNVVAAIEFDKWAAASHHVNFPETEIIQADIRTVDWRRFQNIDLVAGGPPCQPFSVSGKQLGSHDLRDMVPEFVRVVRILRPRAFILENVKGLASQKFSHYLNGAVDDLRRLGYTVNFEVLNAADYGVPQQRERLFVVGMLDGSFTFPRRSHGEGLSRPWVTVGDAIADAPTDEPNKAIVTYCKRPVLRKSPYAGMLLNGKGRPLNLKSPSLTIPASAGGNRTHLIDRDGVLLKYHGQLMNGGKARQGIVPGCRRITVRESARLQGFSDDFVFLGPRSKQYSQVGNAVPPKLAAAVCRKLRTSLQQQMRNVA